MQMKLVKPSGDAERATQTTLETMEISKKLAASWKSPPFQREVRTNACKVVALSAELKATGVIPGVLTLGVLDNEVFIVDGQHRLHGFLTADLVVVYADVRTHFFTTMAAMADEYVRLNTQLVRLRPDDILKGLEQSNLHLQKIRRKCPYVGYDAIRRGGSGPVLSMSTVLRSWSGSRHEVPALGGGAAQVAQELDDDETEVLTNFLGMCFCAWRRDMEYWPLWGSLNLVLCAWLYRRVVVGQAKAKNLSRSMKLDPDQFKRGMLALSASKEYVEYLVGRRVTERDRSPAYNKMKALIAQRYLLDTKQKLHLPGPAWAHGGG